MNREIKFRAWEHDRKIMCYGYKTYISDAERNNYPLMQYTGLKDKNGKEIYEGDVCKVEYYNHNTQNTIITQSVVYEIGTFALKSNIKLNLEIEYTRQFVPLFYSQAPNKIEVIGNIYENPEFENNFDN